MTRKSTIRIISMAAVLALVALGCGDDRDGAGPGTTGDTLEDVSPQGINFYEPEAVTSSCLGKKENPNFPVEYKLACEGFFAENPELEQANACVHLEDQPDAICYCKICAIKGVEKICLTEICN